MSCCDSPSPRIATSILNQQSSKLANSTTTKKLDEDSSLKRKPRMDDPEVNYESLLQGLDLAYMADSLLPLYANSPVNEADFADTPLGIPIPEETDWLNVPIPDPLTFNFNTPTPITDIDIDYTLQQNWWDLDTMPTSTEDSPSATLNSPSVSVQSPGFSPAYSTSPLSTTYSPQEQLLPPAPGPTPKPTPTHDSSSPKKKPQRRRRAKAKPGTRPCDKK